MIDVTFCGETIHVIRSQMREFLDLDAPAQEAPARVATKLKDVSKPASEKVETVTVPAPAPPSQPAPAQQSTTPASYKDLSEYIPKAVSKYGRGKIVTLLEGFGAKTGKDLKSEQYVEVLTKLKAEYPL